MTSDPVCFMDVDELDASARGLTSALHGHTYFFCSGDCKKQFDADPTTYIGRSSDWESTDDSEENYAG